MAFTPSPRATSSAPVASIEQLELLDLLVHRLDGRPAAHAEPEDQDDQYKDPIHDLDRGDLEAERDRLRHLLDALVRVVVQVPGQRRDDGPGKLHSSFVGEDSSIIPGANSWRLGVWRQVADWFLPI